MLVPLLKKERTDRGGLKYPRFNYRALLAIARPVAGLFVGTTANESLAEGD
jgi:hypothetical protein